MPKRRFNWFLLIAVVLSIIVLMVTAVLLRKWQRQRIAGTSLQQGLLAYDNKQWQLAAENLGRYIARNRDDTDMMLKYAHSQLRIRPFQTGNIQQAIASYRSILRNDEQNLQATEELTNIYLQMGLAGEAELIAERFLQKEQNTEIKRLYALSLGFQRKFEQASQILIEITNNNPNDIKAYNLLAQLSEKHPDMFEKNARHWHDLAIDKNPKSPSALLLRASYHLRNSNPQKALKDIKKAEELKEQNFDDHLLFAQTYAKLNMHQKSQDHLIKAETLQPNTFQLWTTWAAIALNVGNNEQMCSVANRGLKALDYEADDFVPFAAELFIAANDHKNAEKCLQKLELIQIQPSLLHSLKGFLAYAKGNKNQAVKSWRTAVAYGDKSEKTHLAYAQALSEISDMQSSLINLHKLVSQQPQSFRARYQLAAALATQGQWPQALEQVSVATQLQPQSLQTALLYAKVQIEVLKDTQVDPNAYNWVQLENKLKQLSQQTKKALPVELIRSELAIKRRNFQKAESILQNLNQNHPDTIELELAYVDLNLAKDRIDSAVESLYQLNKKHPQNLPIAQYLGLVLSEYRTPDQCIKAVKNCIENFSSKDHKKKLSLFLVNYYSKIDMTQQANQLLWQLYEQYPDEIIIKRKLLNFDIVRENHKLSQDLISEIKELQGPDTWQWKWEQARLWFFSEDYKNYYPQIISILKENLEENPDDQQSRLLLAATYEKGENLQLAADTYLQALNRNPDDINIIIKTVSVLYELKDFQKAQDIINAIDPQRHSIQSLSVLELQNYLLEGNLKSAEITIKKMLQQDPNNSTIMLSLAQLYLKNNDLKNAQELLNRLSETQPDSLNVLSLLVELNLKNDKHQDALEICNKIVNKSKKAQAYLLRAKTLQSLGQLQKAQLDFDLAIDSKPRNARIWVARSQFFNSTGLRENAIKDAERALEIEPYNKSAIKNAIELYSVSQDKNKTILTTELIEKGLSKYPQDVDLLYYKAKFLFSKNTSFAINQAISILLQITQRKPDFPQAWLTLTNYYLARDNYQKATESVLRALSFMPDNKQLLILKARCQQFNSAPQAIDTLEKLHQKHPKDPQIALELLDTYSKSKKYDQELAMIEKLLTDANDPAVKFYKIAKANALYNSGSPEEAFDLINTLQTKYPDDTDILTANINILTNEKKWPQIYDKLTSFSMRNKPEIGKVVSITADLALKNDNTAKQISLKILEKIIADNNSNSEPLLACAMILQDQQKPQQAKQYYQKALDLDPNNLIAINNLAWILCEQNKEYKKAETLALRGLQLAPDYIDLIDTAGMIQYRMGDFYQALKKFDHCIENYPRHSPSLTYGYFHRACTLDALGKKQKALESVSRSLKLNSEKGGLSAKDSEQAEQLYVRLTKEVQNGSAEE